MIIKTVFDILTSIILFIVLFPFLILISIIIKIDSKGSILFFQERVGKDGKLFKIIKFRSMIENAINEGYKVSVVSNDYRITRVGKILRNWSIDEIPQIFNILLGNMSFIGPRPTLKYQVDQYDEIQKMRLSVKPGITGLAQICGRKEITWKKRIKYDIWYIKNWSIKLDIYILIKTIQIAFIKRNGLYNNNNLTEFKIYE